jgi:hypothetical protein
MATDAPTKRTCLPCWAQRLSRRIIRALSSHG